MAFDQSTRNRLQRFVNDARRVLEEEFTRQLQNDYGLDPDSGTVTELANLRHIDDAQRETARILRDTVAHYCASGEIDARQGLDRIVREQAFTVLNRLAALRMAEARGLLIESVGNGFQAKGFQLYARLAGTGLGETGDAYRVYLFSVFDELAQDLPGLFDRYAPQGRLFPRETALLAVLKLINDAEIDALWAEDETIGWIYQYFNSKEERKAMREASQAPRNSRELAVRNQFFTPRYVVEFLVDNTLGRLWFNATGGRTALRERCQYLLVKPDEVPQAVSHPRDPRTLKLLDPACGSMHFGLYAFDLFAEIYREAWAWEQAHGAGSLDVSTQPALGLKPLAETYVDPGAYERDIPRLIIEHNIYGVDIDPRAAQIASLALWLRAQRAWHAAGIKAKDRPLVGRGHVVAATAPPAEKQLREQFAARLDHPDAELFNKTLQLLKGVPEQGVLLQVEVELPSLIRQVFGEHGKLFKQADMEQWQKAEGRLQVALSEFAHAAKASYRGRLFAQDALQGLRILDICQSVFDVVLMNPPFGVAPDAVFTKLKKERPTVYTELYAAFVKRGIELLAPGGRLGAITSRAFLYIGRLQEFRNIDLESRINVLLDLGAGVMDDAFVEACAYTVSHDEKHESLFAIDARRCRSKSDIKAVIKNRSSMSGIDVYDVPWNRLAKTPGSKFLYYLPEEIFRLLRSKDLLEPDVATVRQGMGTFDDYRFVRLLWEADPRAIGAGNTWEPLAKGGPYAKYYGQIHLLVNWRNNGAELCAVNISRNGQTAQVRQASDFWRLGGCTYSKRSVKGFSARALPKQCIMAGKGPAIISQSDIPEDYLLGWLNSRLITGLIQLQANASEFNTGILKSLPWISPSREKLSEIGYLSHKTSGEARSLFAFDETDAYFYFKPKVNSDLPAQLRDVCSEMERIKQNIAAADLKISFEMDALYSVDSTSLVEAGDGELEDVAEDDPEEGDSSSPGEIERTYCVHLVSGCIGILVGRWDPKIALSSACKPDIPDVFGDLPFVQPGRWKGPDGFPIQLSKAVEQEEWTRPVDVRVSSAGILVDDPGHQLDAEGQIDSLLRLFWGGESESSDRTLCAVLGFKSLRDYLRSPNGFFGDHLNRYSKSRRQAPIYWPLSTASGSYTLWIYFHNLSGQTLYTAVNDFVEPKLKQIGDQVAGLRNKGNARTREDEKQFEGLQAFELEVIELRDVLLKLAPHYKPNHDDGVQISAAPLWSLFRHKPWQKVLKNTWEKLASGDYDWAHLAMNYWPDRVREKCMTDKSLAIAHGLESLYVEPEAKPKKARGRKKAGDDE